MILNNISNSLNLVVNLVDNISNSLNLVVNLVDNISNSLNLVVNLVDNISNSLNLVVNLVDNISNSLNLVVNLVDNISNSLNLVVNLVDNISNSLNLVVNLVDNISNSLNLVVNLVDNISNSLNLVVDLVDDSSNSRDLVFSFVSFSNNMNVITREKAICMFFCEEYNEDNIQKLTKEVDDFVRCEICYTDDPTKPIIQSKRIINQNPYLYQNYQSRQEVAKENTTEKEKQQLIRLVQFLNTVFVSVDPYDEEMYERQLCSMNDVLTYVWKYSYLLQDKSSVSFGRWCSGKDIDLIRTTTKRRKIDEGNTISVRSLHVLKEKYIANVVKYIVEQLPRYQQTIESFKKDGYNVIGYVRKSRTKEKHETRTKLLNMMCKKLKTHSMVDKIFVSFKTNANEPIIDRDIDDDKKVLEEIDADGNTQVSRYVEICLCSENMSCNINFCRPHN
ncbi:unnamed protein product [Rhizopus stolonifer]